MYYQHTNAGRLFAIAWLVYDNVDYVSDLHLFDVVHVYRASEFIYSLVHVLDCPAWPPQIKSTLDI